MDVAKARKAMVDSQVRPNDVPNVHLQVAMETLPREMFVPANRRSLAYVEKDVPLFEGRWLLKARDFSKLVHGLRLNKSDLVLDVACGFGYSSAVIAQLASVVVGLEDNPDAITKADEIITGLRLDNVAIVEGPLTEGVASQGPYDAILVAGGVEENLDALLEQLKPEGGRLAAIIMERGVGKATLFTRTGDAIGTRTLFEAHPAGVVTGFQAEAKFSF